MRRNLRERALQNQGNDKGGGGGGPAAEQSTCDADYRQQVVPLQLIKDHTGTDVHTEAHRGKSDLNVFRETTIS